MKWYDEQISVYEEELMKEFVESFGFNLKLNYDSCLANIPGMSNQSTKTITMNCIVADTYKRFLSVLFHELSHLIAGQNGHFNIYHNKIDMEPTKENLNKLRRTALKAEMFVDKKAKKLMKSYFPDVPYMKTGYKSKNGRAWLKTIIEALIKSKLNSKEIKNV